MPLDASRRSVIPLDAPRRSGWLHKQGHLARTWKQRFFVLEKGVLSYYASDSRNSSLLGCVPP